jgi:hypothetical protein
MKRHNGAEEGETPKKLDVSGKEEQQPTRRHADPRDDAVHVPLFSVDLRAGPAKPALPSIEDA